MGKVAAKRPRAVIGLLLGLVATFYISQVSVAQNTMFLRNSPIAHLNEADRKILRETIDEALEAPDGSVLEWSNPDTGSQGRIKVLNTQKGPDIVCRQLRARNEASGRRADGIYRLCKETGGTWRFASPESEPAGETEAG